MACISKQIYTYVEKARESLTDIKYVHVLVLKRFLAVCIKRYIFTICDVMRCFCFFGDQVADSAQFTVQFNPIYVPPNKLVHHLVLTRISTSNYSISSRQQRWGGWTPHQRSFKPKKKSVCQLDCDQASVPVGLRSGKVGKIGGHVRKCALVEKEDDISLNLRESEDAEGSFSKNSHTTIVDDSLCQSGWTFPPLFRREMRIGQTFPFPFPFLWVGCLLLFFWFHVLRRTAEEWMAVAKVHQVGQPRRWRTAAWVGVINKPESHQSQTGKK